MPVITTVHDVPACVREIHFRRPRKHGALTYIPIVCKKDKNAYMVQSRSMYMPHFPIYDGTKHALSFELAENHADAPTIACLRAIVEHCIAKAQPRFKHGDDKMPATSMFVAGARHLRFYDIPVETVGVFNRRKERVPLRSVQRHEDIQVIFVVSHVWCNETSIGVKIRPLQIRRLTDAYEAQTALFVDQVEPPLPNPLFEKYQKMLRAGIPMEAIEHKMRMEGLSASDIASFAGKKLIGAAPPPPPPPPLPPAGGIGRRPPVAVGAAPPLNPMAGILAAIKSGGVQLKATAGLPKPAVRQVKAPEGWKPPTLDDLIQAKNRLRSGGGHL